MGSKIPTPQVRRELPRVGVFKSLDQQDDTPKIQILQARSSSLILNIWSLNLAEGQIRGRARQAPAAELVGGFVRRMEGGQAGHLISEPMVQMQAPVSTQSTHTELCVTEAVCPQTVRTARRRPEC